MIQRMILRHFHERIKSFVIFKFFLMVTCILHSPKACFTDILKIEKGCESRLLSATFHMFHKGKLEQGCIGLLVKTSTGWRPLPHVNLNLLVSYESKRLFI